MATHHIGFIYLDEIHHIYHFITIANELSKRHQVSILTYLGEHNFLQNELQRLGGHNVQIKECSTHSFRAVTDKIKKRTTPRVGFWMKKNRKYFLNNFDVLVFSTHIHHKLLKWRKDKAFPKFVTLLHGAPGRAYSYNSAETDYDTQLLFGEFQYQEYKRRKILGKNPVIVGYPKLDAVNLNQKANLFANSKPTVLYSPHFEEDQSSWPKFGLSILKYFYHQKDYNLIFAPHLQLFKKGGETLEEIPYKYRKCPHILIDTGSAKSVDMTYIKAADIYIGDVSSQVYEFIIQPRPCIFFNAHNFDYKENSDFRFWQCGPVLHSPNQLEKTLKHTAEDFAHYKLIQEKITAENFYTTEGSTASERAANAIEKLLPEN